MKGKWILIIVVAVLFLGFVFALIARLMSYPLMCTEMGCPRCSEGLLNEEIPCNGCAKTTYYYSIFVFNVGKTCGAKEYIICENGNNVDMEIRNVGDCNIFVSFFGKNFN